MPLKNVPISCVPDEKYMEKPFFQTRIGVTMARRAALESALSGVRFSYPAVPQLREFQVTVRGYC